MSLSEAVIRGIRLALPRVGYARPSRLEAHVLKREGCKSGGSPPMVLNAYLSSLPGRFRNREGTCALGGYPTRPDTIDLVGGGVVARQKSESGITIITVYYY